jgi:hypothetical protein
MKKGQKKFFPVTLIPTPLALLNKFYAQFERVTRGSCEIPKRINEKMTVSGEYIPIPSVIHGLKPGTTAKSQMV